MERERFLGSIAAEVRVAVEVRVERRREGRRRVLEPADLAEFGRCFTNAARI